VEIEASAGITLKEHLSDKVSLPENQSGQLLPVSATSASKEASAVDLPWEDPPKADMTPSNAHEVYEKSRSDEQELTADLDHQIEDEISILEPPVFEISEAEHIVSSSEIVESSNIPVLENDRLDDELIPVWDVEEPFSANNASIMESSINNGELTTDRPFVLDSTLSESSRLQTASLLNNNEEWLSLVSGLTLESVLS